MHPVLIDYEGRLLTEQPAPPTIEETYIPDSIADLARVASEEAHKQSTTNKRSTI